MSGSFCSTCAIISCTVLRQRFPMSSLIYKWSLSLLLCCVLLTVARAQVSRQGSLSTPAQFVEEGNKYAGERQYDQAVDAYRQAIKLDPTLAAAYHGLGKVYVDMGRASDALGPMRTAIRRLPQRARTASAACCMRATRRDGKSDACCGSGLLREHRSRC